MPTMYVGTPPHDLKDEPMLRLLRVNLTFGSRSGAVGVTIKKLGSSKFALVGSLIPAEAAEFMNDVISNDLTDDELEARARCYGLSSPLR